MRRALRILALVSIVAGLYFARPYVFPEKKVEVLVFRAARGDVRETVTSPTSGTIVSRREAVVAAEANGRVAAIVLQEGDRAAEGAPVVLLDDADVAVEVKAAEAALATRRTALESAELRFAKAEEDLKSAEPLHRQKLMSDEQFRAWRTVRDTARVDIEAAARALREAEVAVERARVALAKRRVCAPFAGVVRRKLVEAGEYVVVGMPCFEIFDDQHVFVRAPLDEVDLPRVRPGLAVDVALEPFGDRLFHGVVRRIEPGVRTAKELNRTGDVEVELTDAPQPKDDGSYPPGEGPGGPMIRVGMSADIEVVTSVAPDVLRVPAYAVHEDDLERYVFVVEKGRIARKTVEVGATNWDFAQVKSGLAEGEAVIVSLDVAGLEPGKAATIKREVTRVEPQ